VSELTKKKKVNTHGVFLHLISVSPLNQSNQTQGISLDGYAAEGVCWLAPSTGEVKASARPTTSTVAGIKAEILTSADPSVTVTTHFGSLKTDLDSITTKVVRKLVHEKVDTPRELHNCKLSPVIFEVALARGLLELITDSSSAYEKHPCILPLLAIESLCLPPEERCLGSICESACSQKLPELANHCTRAKKKVWPRLVESLASPSFDGEVFYGILQV
jgi:hypothetical protein